MVTAIILSLASAAWGQPANLRIAGATQTQIVVRYTAPSSAACTIEVSEESDFTPLVHDVNDAIFTNSHLDISRASTVVTGLDRTVVVGAKTVEQGADGKNYSRALQIDTTHYIRVTCGSGATITARTAPMAFGRTRRECDGILVDPTFAGYPASPTLSWTDRAEKIIDPCTGFAVKRLSMPGDQNKFPDYELGIATVTDLDAAWTNEANLGTGGQATTSTTNASLFLGISSLDLGNHWGNEPGGTSSAIYPHYAALKLNGIQLTAGTSANVGVALTFDGGQTAASPYLDIAATGTETCKVWTSNAAGGLATCGSEVFTYGNFLGASEYRHGHQRKWGRGRLTTSGSSTTVTLSDSQDCTDIFIGAQIVLDQAFTLRTVTGKSCPTITVDTAIDLTAVSGEGWPFQWRDGMGLNPKFGFLVRKSSGDGTIGIRSPIVKIGASATASSTSGGFHQFCSTVATGDGFIKCKFADRIYAIHQTTGEARHLGSFVTTSGDASAVLATGQRCYEAATLWDGTDSNTFWTTCNAVSGGGTRLVKVVLTGDSANNVNVVPAENVAYVQVLRTVTDMIGSSFEGQVNAYDTEYSTTLFPGCIAVGLTNNRYLVAICRRGNQDTYAWIVVYDLGNKLPLGSGGNGVVAAAWQSYKFGQARWGVLHTPFNPMDTTNLAAMQWTLAKSDTSVGVGNMQQVITYDARCTSGCTTTPVWSATTLTASESDNHIRFTSTWPGGACGSAPGGYQSGDPVIIRTDQPGTVAADCYFGKIAVGDWIQLGGEGGAEWIEVLEVVGQTASGLHLRVDRDITAGALGDGPKTVLVGAQNIMYPVSSINGSVWYWDFIADPNGDDKTKQYDMSKTPGGGHQVTRNNTMVATPEPGIWITPLGVSVDKSQFPMTTNSTLSITRKQAFAGVQPYCMVGNRFEGHPSFEYVPSRTRQYYTDVHPLIGCEDSLPTITWVSGNLYRLTSIPNFNPKHHPALLSAGWLTLSDKSSAATGDQISDGTADAYRWCRAVAAGECRTGSSAADVYVNVPNAKPGDRNCTNSASRDADICIMDHPARHGVVIEEIPDHTLSLPEQLARIRNATGVLALGQIQWGTKGLANTSNAKFLTRNFLMTAIYNGDQTRGYRPDSLLIKVPELGPRDTVNRSTLVPVPVQTGVPPNTSTVEAQFGYNTSFHCTTRAESCFAVGSSVSEATPFYWGVEARTRLSCASGCTPVIPAISGKTLYYRVRYYDAGGSLIATGQTEVVAIP